MAPSLILTAIGAPWVGALLVWLIGDRRPRAQHVLAAVAALVAAGAALLLLPAARWQTTADAALRLPFGPFIGDLTFVADSLAVFLAVIATSIGSLTVIFSAGYMAGEAQLGRYYALVLAFIGAMCGLVFSCNLLVLFLFWEVTVFCSDALISFYNDDPRAVAAGIKALIITQLGGVGLLVGILVASAYLPDLQVSTLLASFGAVPSGMLAVVAFGFLLAAMAKSAQFPLHIWLPDAMEAPTPVSALIHAATMVNAGVYLLARFYPAFAGVAGWTTAVVLVGLASVLLAGLLATTCHDLKRTLAYSTVSQLGFMVTGVGLGAIFESQFYLFSHAIFKALLFLGAGAIIHHVGTRDMRRMGGLWSHPRSEMRAVAVPFLIGAAALMGLPLFNGFWSKEILLETALERSPWVYVALVLGAALTAFYVARMCWLVFFRAPEAQGSRGAGEQGSRPHAPLATHSASEDADSAKAHHPSSPAPLLPRAAMLLPLYVLAAGACFAWLLAEPFAVWMLATLPFHTAYVLPHWPVEELISTHTATSLSTAVVLTATLLSVLLWAWTARTSQPGRGATVKRAIGGAEALFNDSAAAVANATRGTAAVLQRTQTGQLNWNLAGLALLAVAMLLLVLLGVV